MTHQRSQDQDLRTALERVRHLKRGTEYEVLGDATAQTGVVGGRVLGDYDKLIVYRCLETGKLWCRFTDEFRDGRFETLTPAQAPGKAGEREGVEKADDAEVNRILAMPDEEVLDVVSPDRLAYLVAERDKAVRQAKLVNDIRVELSDCSTVDYYNISDDGIANIAMIAARTAIAYLAPQRNGTEASRGVGAETRAEVWKERLERAFFDAGGFHGQMIEYAARTALPVVLWARAATPTPPLSPDSTGPAGDDARDEVLFAFHRYAKDLDPTEVTWWTRHFPQYATDIREHAVELIDMRFRAALTQSAAIAAPVRDDGARERIAQAIHDHNFRRKGGTVPWSVVLQYPRYRESYEAKEAYGLADAILASLPAPAGDVPGEAQTQEGGL